jgi:hypothetical protein
VYRYNDTRRPGILEKLEGYEKEKQVFILKNENQIKRFLLNIAEV